MVMPDRLLESQAYSTPRMLHEGVTMAQIQQLKKLQHKHTLQWCLKVGGYTGTLTENQMRQALHVSPSRYRKWMNGHAPVPSMAIHRVKKWAFLPYRVSLQKPLLHGHAHAEETAATFEATAQWKYMLWDAMHPTTKHRFFRRYLKDLLIHRRMHP